MANNVTGNPFIIDTATDAALTNDHLHVFSIMWVSASNDSACSVQDENGNVKFASHGGSATSIIQSPDFGPEGLFFNGMKVPTLGAGKLYIYLKRN